MRVPSATYRIQFSPAFRFKDAAGIMNYLHELGITDLYASPVFKAVGGSPHCYDIVDPNTINTELGDAEEFEELVARTGAMGMGWIQDFVPNHMAYHGDNAMLMDIMEKGMQSKYIGFFDIEWDHPYEGLKGKLLTPFLGRFYAEALGNAEIRLNYGDSGFSINYYNLSFPLGISSYFGLLTHGIKRLEKRLGANHPDFIKFLGILYVLKNLPTSTENDGLDEQVRFIKRFIWELYLKNRQLKNFIDENIEIFNGRADEPESFNLLDELLSGQFFKFVFWKVASEEINYRRFFNINELISLSMEDIDVFNGTHVLIIKMIKETGVTGIRVDHIDGLYDPLTYLNRLSMKCRGTYLIVEKILADGEHLPHSWPVGGTTGYDFMNRLNGLYCQGQNEAEMTKIYETFTGRRSDPAEVLYEHRKLIIEKHMTGDVDNLAHLLKSTLSNDRYGRDLTLHGIRKGITEVMANFPVYRTYIDSENPDQRDLEYIRESVRRAVKRNPAFMNELQFLERVLSLDYSHYLDDQEKMRWRHFVMRLQQFTGPLMAKGFEDTFLYVYNRLLSLNEVGGHPDRFGVSPDEFHDFNLERAKSWPYSMNATSTHDAKRGEDVRARLNVLSEIPDEWRRNVRLWHRINRKSKGRISSRSVPDKNDEYFLYQTLTGSMPFSADEFPDFRERVKLYIIKAIREAKIHTAWLKPDSEYENSVMTFIDKILKSPTGSHFMEAFIPFQKKIAWYGMLNSLSQTLIKIISPGVPDFYQGSEFWDLNLVDPDNRRPVRFETRISHLRKMRKRCSGKGKMQLIKEVMAAYEDGRIKLFLINCTLRARREKEDLYREGSYLPLEVRGKCDDHVIAFARRDKKNVSLAIAPRFFTSLAEEKVYPVGEAVWKDTAVFLPDEMQTLKWRDVITGEEVPETNSVLVGRILRHFPVSLLEGKIR